MNVGMTVVMIHSPALDALIPAGAKARWMERPGRLLKVMIREGNQSTLYAVVKDKDGKPVLIQQGRNVRS